MTLQQRVTAWAGTGLLLGALTQGTAPAQGPGLPASAPGSVAVPLPTAPAPEEEKPWYASAPPVQPLPKTGWSPVPPTGPGFYTGLDWLKGEEREKPPKYPHPRFGIFQNSFFDMDWRYLDDPKNTEHDFFDCLKRQRFACDTFMFTTGGEFRYRYNHEVNSRLFNGDPARLRGRNNTYDLTRVRVYGDLWVTDRVRLFAEYTDAQTFNQDLPPLPIDRNWGDLLNAFIDLKTFELADRPVWVRVGRQELLYGSQRLISPLDWANSRRTFQGVKAFWQGETLSLDAFVVQPVIPVSRRFDSGDNNVIFSGLWGTWRPNKDHTIDGFVLNLDRAGPAYSGRNNVLGAGNVSTVGGRWLGRQDNWLWDAEGAMQFGTHSNQSLFAQWGSLGGGYYFADVWSTPTLWLTYEYASGDPSPGTGGVRRSFQQLFPFGHYYFGFIDVVGRQNIQDLSLVASAYPSEWVTLQTQFHNFYLARSRDALYNAAGLPVRQSRTGAAGRHVGQEVDFLVNFHLDHHQDILISYSYLWAGDFIRQTATTPAGRRDPQALYVQYSYRW